MKFESINDAIEKFAKAGDNHLALILNELLSCDVNYNSLNNITKLVDIAKLLNKYNIEAKDIATLLDNIENKNPTLYTYLVEIAKYKDYLLSL